MGRLRGRQEQGESSYGDKGNGNFGDSDSASQNDAPGRVVRMTIFGGSQNDAATDVRQSEYTRDYCRSAVIFMLRSTAVAEWVSAPTEMKSTPVLA